MTAKPRKWVRKRSAAVVRAEKREAKAEVRAYASGAKKMRPGLAANVKKYGQFFPPDVAAREARLETDYHQNRVADRHPNKELRRRRQWTLAKANVGRDKRGRFTTRRAGR